MLTFADVALYQMGLEQPTGFHSPALRARCQALWPVFLSVGREAGVAPSLLAGVAWQESDFEADAVNTASGAAGLMQIMPPHFAPLGWVRWTSVRGNRGIGGAGWSDPPANVRAGADILASAYANAGSLARALADYGGFVTTDPTHYVHGVLTRALVVKLSPDMQT